MNTEHVVALLMLIAEMRVQIGNLSAENEQLRAQLGSTQQEPESQRSH
jgi:hypothetical protein